MVPKIVVPVSFVLKRCATSPIPGIFQRWHDLTTIHEISEHNLRKKRVPGKAAVLQVCLWIESNNERIENVVFAGDAKVLNGCYRNCITVLYRLENSLPL